MTSTVFADKPGRGKGHHSDNYHRGPSFSSISISPQGFHYGYYNRDFGISINRGFADFGPVLEPTVAVIPTPEVIAGPVDYPVVEYPVVNPGVAVENFQSSAFAAFKAAQYEEAQRLVEHALIDEPDNPYLLLYASQVHFANGNYQRAAIEVEAAINTLPQNEWDAIIRDFENLYGRNDYVVQMSRLERYCFENPTDVYAITLRGFHFGCLGHPVTARRDFEKAIAIDPGNSLAQKLLNSLGQANPVVPNPEGPSSTKPLAPQPVQPTYTSPDSPLKSVVTN
jgi:tetratricopeptide (TPR) repeat protein